MIRNTLIALACFTVAHGVTAQPLRYHWATADEIHLWWQPIDGSRESYFVAMRESNWDMTTGLSTGAVDTVSESEIWQQVKTYLADDVYPVLLSALGVEQRVENQLDRWQLSIQDLDPGLVDANMARPREPDVEIYVLAVNRDTIRVRFYRHSDNAELPVRQVVFVRTNGRWEKDERIDLEAVTGIVPRELVLPVFGVPGEPPTSESAWDDVWHSWLEDLSDGINYGPYQVYSVNADTDIVQNRWIWIEYIRADSLSRHEQVIPSTAQIGSTSLATQPEQSAIAIIKRVLWFVGAIILFAFLVLAIVKMFAVVSPPAHRWWKKRHSEPGSTSSFDHGQENRRQTESPPVGQQHRAIDQDARIEPTTILEKLKPPEQPVVGTGDLPGQTEFLNRIEAQWSRHIKATSAQQLVILKKIGSDQHQWRLDLRKDIKDDFFSASEKRNEELRNKQNELTETLRTERIEKERLSTSLNQTERAREQLGRELAELIERSSAHANLLANAERGLNERNASINNVAGYSSPLRQAVRKAMIVDPSRAQILGLLGYFALSGLSRAVGQTPMDGDLKKWMEVNLRMVADGLSTLDHLAARRLLEALSHVNAHEAVRDSLNHQISAAQQDEVRWIGDLLARLRDMNVDSAPTHFVLDVDSDGRPLFVTRSG